MSVKLKYFRNLMRIICVSVCVFCMFIGSALSNDMTANLFDISSVIQETTYPNGSTVSIKSDGTIKVHKVAGDRISVLINKVLCQSGKTYTLKAFGNPSTSTAYPQFDDPANQIYLSGNNPSRTFIGKGDYNQIVVFAYPDSVGDAEYKLVLVEGDTAPTEYIPYGCKIPDGYTGGAVDLGSLTWQYNSTYQVFVASQGTNHTIADMKLWEIVGAANTPCYSSKYKTNTVNDWYNFENKSIASGTTFWSASNKTIIIKDLDYADVNAFKDSLSGTCLYYQRSTDATWSYPAIQIATTKYVEDAFADSVSELNTTMGTIKNVVNNTIIQADRIGKLHTGKQTRPDEQCPKGRECLLITEPDGSLHWYPICDANGSVDPIE